MRLLIILSTVQINYNPPSNPNVYFPNYQNNLNYQPAGNFQNNQYFRPNGHQNLMSNQMFAPNQNPYFNSQNVGQNFQNFNLPDTRFPPPRQTNQSSQTTRSESTQTYTTSQHLNGHSAR